MDTIDDDSLESSNVDNLPLMLRNLDSTAENRSSNDTSSEPPPPPERVSDVLPPERVSDDPPPKRDLRRGQRKRTLNSNIWNDDTVVPDRNNDPETFISQRTYFHSINNAFLHSLSWIKPTPSPNHAGHWNRFSNYIARHMDYTHNTWENPHPVLLSAKANDEDNPKWH